MCPYITSVYSICIDLYVQLPYMYLCSSIAEDCYTQMTKSHTYVLNTLYGINDIHTYIAITRNYKIIYNFEPQKPGKTEALTDIFDFV